MRLKSLSYVVVLCLAVCSTVLAAEATGLQRISEHVYGYVDAKKPSPAGSFGANTGVVLGRDAALVVDTLISAKEAQRFLADIRKVTDKPIKYVVNTHHHLDHAWGNNEFVKHGATVIAHKNALVHVAEDTQALAHPEQYGLTPQDLEGTALQGPAITFTDVMTIDLGGVTVELRYPGPTHTDDSIAASIPQDKVLFVGDMLFTDYHPFLGQGDLANWQDVLAKLQQLPADKIIPGHGPVSGKTDLEYMKTYLQKFDAEARALCAGKSAEDAPAIAQKLIERLALHKRAEQPMLLPNMVEFNLRLKYLPQPKAKK